jgi:hypothetical protein
MTGLLVAASVILMGQASSTPCIETPQGLVEAAALKPSDVLLGISSPRAGEMLAEDMPSQSITVFVDYRGPRLVSPESAHAIDEYHLAYFLDSDASAYVGTLMPTPRCNVHVIQSASTSVTFDHVMRGSHTLWVLLVGANDVSVNPPVAASVSFAIK